MKILGIESSCDETAAAVVVDGHQILSSVVASQIAIHKPYGGVVPELASRKHIEVIATTVEQALDRARLTSAQIDALAVTQGPGLVGCLLVGFCYAKAFAFARSLPWVGVDHLEGHLHSVFLSSDPPPLPFIALLVSGGHTGIYYVAQKGSASLMGQTRDDAAGEAFDKISKLLGLGYPGGTAIEGIAKLGDPEKIKFPRPFMDKSQFDFSFSGLKTAVSRYVQTHAVLTAKDKADIAAGFQEAVIDVLIHKIVQAMTAKNCRNVAIVGGVAANSRLRDRLASEAAEHGISIYMPPLSLCGDNAAMIAAAGYTRYMHGQRGRLDDDVYSRSPRDH